MARELKIAALIAAASILFTGCSGGKGKEALKQTAQKVQKEVPHGPLQPDGKYRCDINKGDAIKVNPKQEAKPLTEDTQIRIWHYQNGDKYICLLQGKAVLEEISAEDNSTN